MKSKINALILALIVVLALPFVSCKHDEAYITDIDFTDECKTKLSNAIENTDFALEASFVYSDGSRSAIIDADLDDKIQFKIYEGHTFAAVEDKSSFMAKKAGSGKIKIIYGNSYSKIVPFTVKVPGSGTGTDGSDNDGDDSSGVTGGGSAGVEFQF